MNLNQGIAKWFKGIFATSEVYCPVCGYYCLGRGGMECIDKPMIIAKERLRKNEDDKGQYERQASQDAE